MHVNNLPMSRVWTFIRQSEIFQPFCGFWCGVTTSAPKQFVDYPFTITKYKNYFRKKHRIWKYLPFCLLQFKGFLNIFTSFKIKKIIADSAGKDILRTKARKKRVKTARYE